MTKANSKGGIEIIGRQTEDKASLEKVMKIIGLMAKHKQNIVVECHHLEHCPMCKARLLFYLNYNLAAQTSQIQQQGGALSGRVPNN